MIQTLQTHRSPRLLAWALTFLLCGPVLAGLTGCGSKADSGQTTGSTAPAAPVTAPNAPVSSAAPNATNSNTPAPKTGMSTRNKVIILAGAALLYYLYKKHQAAQQPQGGTQANGAQPQLYRSSNGSVYYRDPQNPQKVTWLTVPNQPVQVPAGDVQRYAPDYQQYQGQAAPAAPAGQPSQSFSQYDPSLAGG